MAGLYVSRLERDMRMDIERSRYSEMELEGIRCILQRTVDARGKAARIAAAVLVAFDTFYVWAEFFANPNHVMGAFAFSMTVLVVLEVLIWWFVWFIQIGLLKRDFNRAVERGYPQLFTCRLR